MHFAAPVPLWLVVMVAAGIACLAFFSYRRLAAPLTSVQRGVLIALRALTLGALVFFVCRPVVLMPPASARDIVVPVLVDVSRSMRVADADGETRMARASAVLQRDLWPALSRQFTPELYAVGETLTPATADHLSADARHSDLTGALAAVRERYRGRRVSGIVLLSDGGDTSEEGTASGRDAADIPIFTVGIGSTEGFRDREVLGITAGDPRLDRASVDLHVSTVSHGFGRTPFELRLLANGRAVDSRRIVPAADGSPVDEVFTASPDPLTPTVYTARIDAEADDAVTENNAQSVLVGPPGPKRQVLAIEGAPAFEHSFITRALAHDPGLELDSIVRKGANDNGRDTFFVQAGPGRAAALTSGFPSRREVLYSYESIIVANLEGDFFTRAQLQMLADFVSERGGGLLVLGGRSFTEHGLIGTPVEEVLPVELNDWRAGLVPTSYGADPPAAHNTVALTRAGESHPIMRLGESADETRRRWAALPPLAATAPLGVPRPGAAVLAVTAAPGGAIYPVIAVQRYGRGRSMIFGGEASWRWRMMLPSTDRTYEFFWRQAARWLASAAPDPVTVLVPESAEPGDSVEIGVDARDAAFAAAGDATIEATVTSPGGESSPLTFRHDSAVDSRFLAGLRPGRTGLYRIRVEARRGTTSLGTADRWFYVGGGDREFADPRLNEAFLRRVARASGGRYVQAGEAARLVSWLQAAVPQNAEPERRDVWHQPWAFVTVIVLLSAEWMLRRRWGLR